MLKSNTDSIHYHDSPFLPDANEEESGCKTQTALVVLNSPIHSPPSPLFTKLWNMASFRVCADGGANRLFDATNGTDYVPDLIRGDLDSLRDDVKKHYVGKGTRIEVDPRQDNNDLDKCLHVISNEWLDLNRDNYRVCIYGAFGGRFDQEMGSIQALYVWRDVFQNRISLYDDRTCAFLLSSEVVNKIRLPFYGEDKEFTFVNIGDGPTCGLIPIANRCKSIKTTGLKWNLNNETPLEFGGLVSTSNRIMEPLVTVVASDPVVFTAEVWPGLQA